MDDMKKWLHSVPFRELPRKNVQKRSKKLPPSFRDLHPVNFLKFYVHFLHIILTGVFWRYSVNQKTMTTLFVYIVSRDSISMLLLLHLPLLERWEIVKWLCGLQMVWHHQRMFLRYYHGQSKCKILGRVVQSQFFSGFGVAWYNFTILEGHRQW